MANIFHEKPKYVVMMDHDNNSEKVKNFMILLYNLKKCKNTNLSACNHGHLGCQDFIRVNAHENQADMHQPKVEIVLFWRATRCGFAKNC